MSTTIAPTATLQKKTSASTLRLIRKIHLYFGVFISPAVLFFALTGAVQTLSLHEAAGSSYKPPRILAELGQLHKKQTTEMPVRKAPQTGATHEGAGRPGHATAPANATQPAVTLASKQAQHLPMKIFFLVVAVGLFTSTITGIFMSYKYDRNKVLVTATLIAGVVVPFLLLKF